ncbi:MAG: hypothetical protein WA610_05000 [Thermodesulfovibrionales bacterium]
MQTEKPLNQRKFDRYVIDEIPVQGIGSIVEVSRKGLKIRKAPGFSIPGPALNFKLSTVEIKTAVRWEDSNFIGLQFEGAFNDPSFIIKRIRRPKEAVVPPQMSIPAKSILQYKKDEILTAMVNLLMEVESSEPNLTKIGTFINEICVLEEKEKKVEEGTEEGKEEALLEVREQTFIEQVIARAVSLHSWDQGRVIDINFAITTLGLDNVREILRNYVHKRIFKTENAVPVFQDIEVFNILKSAVFKNLCRVFGLSEIQPEGNALLSFETVGVEILIRESSGILDSYYKSPSRLYSEISRMYEKAFFGADPVLINKYYFEKGIGTFQELYHGYVLAHMALNPQYSPSEDLKISLTRNGLVFSYMAYLTFLAVCFIMDKDRESGFILAQRLRGKGMDEARILNFLDTSISEARTIAKDFGVKETFVRPPLSAGSFKIEAWVGKDSRFRYLVQSFMNFDRMNLGRIALRCEDSSYAHFILGKLMNADVLKLSTKTFCVVPCGNVSDDQWYVRDFTNFDLLVFKNINKLPAFHLSTFIKLWNSFEGQIIVTFSTLDFLDYTKPELHALLNSSLVDFPSYFLNDTVYRKMVEHSVQCLKPYIGEQQVDNNRYANEVYTMNHIKTDILLNKEIS